MGVQRKATRRKNIVLKLLSKIRDLLVSVACARMAPRTKKAPATATTSTELEQEPIKVNLSDAASLKSALDTVSRDVSKAYCKTLKLTAADIHFKLITGTLQLNTDRPGAWVRGEYNCQQY